jgi:predicted RNA-binding Zn-ribbon protein involved in translation (DUF1610 family)
MRLLSKYREGNPWLPGGYPFTDPRTGLKFDAMSADLKMQAQNVIKHRRGNPHVYHPDEPKYLDLDWVMLEIEDALCTEAPQYCGDDNVSKPDPTIQVETPDKDCPKCGKRNWLPLWCQSCGRPKILNYKCAECTFVLK